MKTRFFELSPDMLCIASIDGRLIDVNGSWSTILGWHPDDLCGHQYTQFVHPEDVAATVQEAERVAQGGVIRGFCNRYATRDGRYRWFEWRATLDEETRTVHAVARDITEWREVNERLRERESVLTRMVAEQVTTREDEQQRIAAELHDSTLQHAIAALMFIDIASETGEAGPEALAPVRQQVQATIDSMRRVMRGLGPFELDHYDLARGIQRLAGEVRSQFGLLVEVVLRLEEPIGNDAAATAYRIVREGLVNAGKHAQASRAVATLEACRGELRISVRDDGRGTPTTDDCSEHAGLGFGLRTMRERARRAGGELEFNPSAEGSELAACILLKSPGSISDP